MSFSQIINSIGLMLDIIGVILIFFFGIPPSIDRRGDVFLVTGETDEKEKNKAKRYDSASIIALTLIVVGFTLQLISNFIKNGN